MTNSNVIKFRPASKAELRWPEEYRDAECKRTHEQESRDRSMDVYRVYRAAALISAGSTGIGMTFLCIGICMMHFPTILLGVIMGAVFAVSSCVFDKWSEEELDHVCNL